MHLNRRQALNAFDVKLEQKRGLEWQISPRLNFNYGFYLQAQLFLYTRPEAFYDEPSSTSLQREAGMLSPR